MNNHDKVSSINFKISRVCLRVASRTLVKINMTMVAIHHPLIVMMLNIMYASMANRGLYMLTDSYWKMSHVWDYGRDFPIQYSK